jgi:parvulin-like peptidyl-prolyl isomerase
MIQAANCTASHALLKTEEEAEEVPFERKPAHLDKRRLSSPADFSKIDI